MKVYRSFAAALILLTLACNKEEVVVSDEVYPDFLIFGQFFNPSSCTGETCSEIFKMETGSIGEDSNELMPDGTTPYIGNYDRQLSIEVYSQVEAIFRDNIPQALLDMPSGYLGNAVNGEFFFIYFEYKTKDEHKFWKINSSSLGILDPDIQEFTMRIQQAVNIANLN